MDKLSRDEQIRLAARTTIMMGVHGNGLTHLLWMNNQNPRSTVVEFFYPGGFAEDYEFTARALGIRHYGVWDDTVFTAPDTPQIAYPEGFQGNEIPLSEYKRCHLPSASQSVSPRLRGPALYIGAILCPVSTSRDWTEPLLTPRADGKAVADLVVQRLVVEKFERVKEPVV
jgi:hypothetical protein